jgi:hypothetical protein
LIVAVCSFLLLFGKKKSPTNARRAKSHVQKRSARTPFPHRPHSIAMMAVQYNGLADLLLAASRALDTASPTFDAAVPQIRVAPSKRWIEDSSSGSESDASSATPSSRKRVSTAGRKNNQTGKHPYRRTKKTDADEEEEDKLAISLSGPAQHNEVEKRRRAYLSSCYVDLKMLVPSIAQSKASNVTILQTAAKHVKELDASAKKLATQIRAAKRKRERLQQQVAELRAQQAAAAQQAWSPPHVGDSSDETGSPGMEDDLVPDTLTSVVDDVAAQTPSFGDATASVQSSPVAWGKKGFTTTEQPVSVQSGIDLLMLLAASADARAPPFAVPTTCAQEVAMAPVGPAVAAAVAEMSRNRSREARKPARFL